MTVHIIGRYKIIRELRRGGMATVYRAYDPHFEREVAVKVLPRELLFDSQFRVRFNTEAKTLASLEHPAIVPVYDFGEQDGQPYLVMRYMPGGSLEDRLKQGNLSLGEASSLLARLAPALDEAHARGMVHRDLKPANILFDQRSNPYITDFGVVKISGIHMTDTANRSIGTPAYMSPEQARGEADIDSRSDIFALGAVLFEMLTGKIPYDADTPTGQLVRRITDPVPNILELRPDLPPSVQEVIARSLAKRRYVRFATASDMARALEAVNRGKSPKDTLILEKKTAVPTGQKITAVPGSPINVKPRLVKKPVPQKERSTFIQRLPWIFVIGIVLAAVFYIAYQVYIVNRVDLVDTSVGTTGQSELSGVAAASIASPTTSPPVFGSVFAVSGSAASQLPGQEPTPLDPGTLVLLVPGLRLWTTSGNMQIRMQDDADLWLADNTMIALPEEIDISAQTSEEQIVILENGSLLVKAPLLRVITAESAFQAVSQFSTMGVYFKPTLGRFLVDCLEGGCLVGGTNPVAVNGGERAGFDHNEAILAEAAQYDYWIRLGSRAVPTPTFTPTLTATPTLEPTAIPTERPTRTPEPTATNSPALAPTYSPPVIQPTSPPVQQPTSAPRPTNPPAPQPTPTTFSDPNQG